MRSMGKTVWWVGMLGLLVIRLGWGRAEQLVAGTKVRLTIPTIDYPEYSESQTIIKRGEWEVWVKGYMDFTPGAVVEIEGVVEQGGRVSEAKVLRIEYLELKGVDWMYVQIARLRYCAVARLQRGLPEPYASLAIGILLGVKRKMPGEFYQALVNTGMLHIVAASGYNVAVASGTVLAVVGRVLPTYWALGMSGMGVGFYVLLAGASASVVRAGVMGILSMIGIMLGRQREARHLLWISVWLMLVVSPDLITDIGFQLSVGATLGLLYLVPMFERAKKQRYLSEYLYPTLAATIATAPIIWWHFGRVSTVGILVNLLVLPLVPLVMLLSALAITLTPISYLLYVPLWWVVEVIRFFG